MFKYHSLYCFVLLIFLFVHPSHAPSTREYYITKLLKKATATSKPYLKHLQKCASEYEKAISAIETSYNDLNSETFFDLADLAGVASHSAEDCQATFKGCHHCPLDFTNNALKGLCEICVFVSKLLAGS